MVRVESQFAFELRLGFVVLLRLPVEISEAKVHVRFGGSNLGGSFELGNGVCSFARAVERFSVEDMGRGGIRVLLKEMAEFLHRAREILRPQAALRQQVMQLRIPGIALSRGLKVLDGVGKLL